MLTREKVIWFHFKANIVNVILLHETINIILSNDMFLKSVRFIFFHLKNEMLRLPHLKNKINFLPFLQTHSSNMLLCTNGRDEFSCLGLHCVCSVSLTVLCAKQLEWLPMSRAWLCNVWERFDLTVLQLWSAWRFRATKRGMRDCMAESCAVPTASAAKLC